LRSHQPLLMAGGGNHHGRACEGVRDRREEGSSSSLRRGAWFEAFRRHPGEVLWWVRSWAGRCSRLMVHGWRRLLRAHLGWSSLGWLRWARPARRRL